MISEIVQCFKNIYYSCWYIWVISPFSIDFFLIYLQLPLSLSFSIGILYLFVVSNRNPNISIVTDTAPRNLSYFSISIFSSYYYIYLPSSLKLYPILNSFKSGNKYYFYLCLSYQYSNFQVFYTQCFFVEYFIDLRNCFVFTMYLE